MTPSLLAAVIFTLAQPTQPAQPAVSTAASLAPAYSFRASEVELPATPQGRCVAAWISMVRAGGPAECIAFETEFRAAKRLAESPIEARAARVPKLRTEFGAMTLAEVVSVAPTAIVTKIQSSTRGDMDVTFQFDADGKLDAIQIASMDPGAASEPLTAERRTAITDAAIAAVRSEYVFPEKGAAMASAVEKARDSGAYDGIIDERGLADRLTADFRAVTNDRHLRVGIAPAGDEAADHFGPDADEARRENWAFRSCEVAPGNIGVLRFDGFLADDEAKKVVDASFAFLARCDAIVFDVRANGGGSPELLDYIAGYLFEKPTLLNRMIDRNGNVIGEGVSDETVAGQRFSQDLPLFVVTSRKTFSCAEEFAYDLQSLKRATIVGETTGGGAHPVKPVRLDDRMIIRMPHLRANNPITNTNWEGDGVKPDVSVPAEQAIEKALELARATIAATKKS